MTDGYNAKVAEEIAEEKYREASERLAELEQKRLKDIFLTLGDVASSVEAGDRRSMLELLAITTDSLREFEVLPQQAREALANCLEKMRDNLEEAKGFLPRGRGERSERDADRHAKVEFFTAFAVEWARQFDGLSLEDAMAKVEEELCMTGSLIHKRWKRHHKEAKDSLDMTRELLSDRIHWPTMPRRRKRRT